MQSIVYTARSMSYVYSPPWYSRVDSRRDIGIWAFAYDSAQQGHWEGGTGGRAYTVPGPMTRRGAHENMWHDIASYNKARLRNVNTAAYAMARHTRAKGALVVGVANWWGDLAMYELETCDRYMGRIDRINPHTQWAHSASRRSWPLPQFKYTILWPLLCIYILCYYSTLWLFCLL